MMHPVPNYGVKPAGPCGGIAGKRLPLAVGTILYGSGLKCSCAGAAGCRVLIHRATILPVSILSFLLRILLCLTLALTGWAEAFAAAAMHPAAESAGAGPDEGPAPPCHGEAHAQTQDGHVEHPVSDPGADCCTGACDCPCANLSVALALAPSLPPTASHARYAPAAKPEVGTRALPLLIRPPIG
jgi:hypothetical protein